MSRNVDIIKGTIGKGKVLSPVGRVDGRERWATGSSVSYRKIIPTWCSGKEFSQKKKKKNSPSNTGDAGDVGSILGLGRSPGEGNGNPLQYSCLENSMDRGTGRLQSMGTQ